MKTLRLKNLLLILFLTLFSLYLAGCSENVSTEDLTDDEFLKEVITKGYSSNSEDDDNLLAKEISDLDDGGPVPNGGGDTPIDSLERWGRIILSVNLNVTITSEGDSIKIATITRTITGNYIIIGYVNAQLDTVVKPYTMVLNRKAWFKRVAHTPRPRFNWRLYKVSMLDGQTTQPQVGTDYVEMNKVEVFINGTLVYTFQGPDFTQNVFTSRFFNGSGIPECRRGDQVKIKVYTFSKQSEPDIVAWHWARNTFGFHRVPFVMISQVPNGQYWDRVYEKTFNIYTSHLVGRFNGHISASTHKSLYDDSPAEFASDLVGTPYRVLP